MPLNDSPSASSDNVTIPERGLRTTLSALSIRNYRFFWLGMLSTFFGNQMQQPTQSWLAFKLTNSPLLLGLTFAFQGIPQLIISPLGGLVIDRVQKRNLIMITQFFTILVNLTIAILITTGHIQYWHLLISSFLTGLNNAFSLPARNSFVPELVPREKMYNGIALLNGGNNLARVIGPALAGVLIAVIGTQGAYYVGVGFNVLAIATLSFLSPTSKLGIMGNKSTFTNLKEGFSYLRIHNIILILLGMEIGLTFFGMSYQGLMPVFADLLKVGPEKYGFMLSAVGIGSLIGVFTIASLGNFKRKGLVLLGAGIIFGLFLIFFGNSVYFRDLASIGSNNYYIALFMLLIVGMSSISYSSTSLTIIQMYIDDEYRGRVTSVYQIVIALYPFSILVSSAVAEILGAPLALTIGGGCLTAFMLIMASVTRRIRNLE